MKLRNLDRNQKELVIGDMLDNLGHDVSIRVEWFDERGKQGIYLEGNVYAEDKTIFEEIPVVEETIAEEEVN